MFKCVVREVNPGDKQFVPAEEVVRRMGSLIPGEAVYLGNFNGRAERCGPYGSDTRVICLPVGRLEIENASPSGQLTLN